MAKMTEIIPESSVSSTSNENLLHKEKSEDKDEDPEVVEEPRESVEEKKDHVSDLAMQTMEVQEKITTNADSKCFNSYDPYSRVPNTRTVPVNFKRIVNWYALIGHRYGN